MRSERGTAPLPLTRSRGAALESPLRRTLLRSAVLFGLTGFDSRSASANALRVGEAAPPATLELLDGRQISTASLRGHVIILTFWATWCGPCREELPLLSAYAAEHAAQGLTVLGFALDSPDDLHKVGQVARTLRFPVGLLARSTLPGYGRIWRIPVSFTIDRQGRLVDDGWKHKDSTLTAERLKGLVTPLLENSG